MLKQSASGHMHFGADEEEKDEEVEEVGESKGVRYVV